MTVVTEIVTPARISPKHLRTLALWVIGLVLGLVVARAADFVTPLPVVVLGAIIGTTYGLLAVDHSRQAYVVGTDGARRVAI